MQLAARCTALTAFQANGCSGLGDESLIALAKHCARLARIDVRACSRVTEHGLEAASRLLPGCRVYANTLAVNLS